MKSIVFIGLLLTFALAVHADTSATDLLVRDTSIYIGGEQANSDVGNHITLVRSTTGHVQTLDWGCNAAVRKVQVIDGYAYLGGDFSQCDNRQLGPFVRYDLDRGTFEGMTPSGFVWRQNLAADSNLVYGEWGGPSVYDWQFVEGELFIVGLFALTNEDTEERWNNVAAVNLDTGVWRTFGDGLDGPVYSLWVQDPMTIFFGGSFNREGYAHNHKFSTPGFVVWHGDHPRYSGFNPYTIAFENNNFDQTWNIDGPVYAIWRGIIQTEPSGERLNPPTNVPEPARLTLVIAGGFTAGVLYQQDSLPWRRADGGVWGGPVRAMLPATDLNAFFFAGGFTQAGAAGVNTGQHPEQGPVAVGGFARWNYQNWVPRGGNSRPQKVWDALGNRVSGGDVYGLARAPLEGLLLLTGAFTAPQPYVVAYDLAKSEYDPITIDDNGRAVSLFDDTLYTAEIGSYQRQWNSWEGLWTDESWYNGRLAVCADGNRLSMSNNVVAFDGFVSHDGQTLSGSWVRAGDNSEGARGKFSLQLRTGGLEFKGWYTIDGEFGRHAWAEQRLSGERPTLWTCNAINLAEGETVGGQFANSAGNVLDMCISGIEATGSTSSGRLYQGTAVHGGKTVHAQYYDDSGYGVSLFRQTSVDRVNENWFAGDLRDLDVSKCVLGVTCGIDMVWDRNSGVAPDPALCEAQSWRNLWSGEWALNRANAVLYMAQSGDGRVTGSYGGGLFEGRIDESDPEHLTGHWIMAGFVEIVGQLRGSFDIRLEPGSNTFTGSYQIDRNVEGDIITDGDGNPAPIRFRWASRRISRAVPDAALTFSRAANAGRSVAGTWKIVDGPAEAISICLTGQSIPETEVIASVGSRFYEGDATTLTAEGIDADGNTLATLNWWDDFGTGVSIMRRVGATTLEEQWFTGNTLEFSASECTGTTCNLADRGTYSVTYQYLGLPTTSACSENAAQSPERFRG